MDKKKRRQLEKIINKEIKENTSSIEEYKQLTKPISPENSIGRVSRMDAINNKSVLEAALREAQSKLIQLNDINNKIASSDFGLCKTCKKSIPFGRLMIRPESQLCVNCAK